MALPVCTIDENGIFKPDYADALAYLEAEFRAIYGEDIYIEPDSQDGQMLAIFAAAIDGCNAQAVAIYNAFSPSSARGVGLSSVVKINGIKRLVASYSTVDLVITGQGYDCRRLVCCHTVTGHLRRGGRAGAASRFPRPSAPCRSLHRRHGRPSARSDRKCGHRTSQGRRARPATR